MRFLRAVPVVALIAALAPGNGALARPARAPSIPDLAGTTTVVGSTSAVTRVRLREAVDYRKTFVRYSGDGRVVGVVLVREVKGRVPKNPKIFEAVRLADCLEEACAPSPSHELGGWGGTEKVYRPGIYRLYLLADGAPVTMTLTFRQLDGRTTIAPTSPARALVQNMTPAASLDVTRSFYSAGDLAPFDGVGMAWMSQTIEPSGNGTAVYDYCIYWDEAPTVEANAYLPPNCPKGSSQYRPEIREYTATGDDHLGAAVAIYDLPAALGNWYATTTPVDKGGSVAAWLQF